MSKFSWFQFAPGVQLFLPQEVFQRDVASDRVKFVYLKNGKLFRNNPNQPPQSVGGVLSASVGPDSDFDLKACVKYTMPNKQVRPSDLLDNLFQHISRNFEFEHLSRFFSWIPKLANLYSGI